MSNRHPRTNQEASPSFEVLRVPKDEVRDIKSEMNAVINSRAERIEEIRRSCSEQSPQLKEAINNATKRRVIC